MPCRVHGKGIWMRLGVQIEPQFGFEYGEVLAIADLALKVGVFNIWFSDHLLLDRDATDRVLLDPLLLMTALARDAREVRVGGLVFCNSYRNPALLAKMCATIDVLSSGRLEFGIGAGWKELDYRTYGYPFPPARTRIEQLDEALHVIKGA